MDFPIQLPNYRVKGQVVIRYSTSPVGSYYNWKEVVLDEEIEPSSSMAAQLIQQHVPDSFKDLVQYVAFEPDQPMDKVRYGQAIVDEDDAVMVYSIEFSITRYEYDAAGKMKKRSMRWNSDHRDWSEINPRIYIE